MKKWMFLILLVLPLQVLISQGQFFGEIDLVEFDSLSQGDVQIVEQRDLEYQNCNSDTCKLTVLWNSFNELSDWELRNRITNLSFELIEVNKKINNSPEVAKFLATSLVNVYGSIGELNIEKGDYSKSMIHYKKALDLAKQAKDTSNLLSIYNNIGYVCGLQLDNEAALNYYIKAKDLAIPYNAPDLCGQYLNIAAAYNQLDCTALVIENYNHCILTADPQENSYILSIACLNIGTLYFGEGSHQNLDSAARYFKRAMELTTGDEDSELTYVSQKSLISLYEIQEKFEEAEKVSEKNVLLARDIGMQDYLEGALLMQYEIKIELGEYQEAVEIQNEIIEIKDKQRKNDDAKMLADLKAELKYESAIELNKAKIASAELESKQKTRMVYGALIALAVIALFLVLLFINRNKLRKSEIRLQELDRTNKEIFSVISHDFKEPIMSLDLLIKTIGRSEKIEDDYLIELQQEMASSKDVLNNLLNWAQSELEALEVMKKPIALQELWNKVIETSIPIADRKKIKIKNSIRDSVKIMGDPVTMEIVFRNLLSNAIKYSPENGVVHIDGNKSSIQVVDQGQGMSSDLKDIIFKSKVNSSYGTKGETGFGLGLFISEHLVKKNGGKLFVTDNKPSGAIFNISLD